MPTPLRQFHGESFNPSRFHHVKATLAESCKNVLPLHRDEVFLSFFGEKEHDRKHWTYQNFFQTVGGVQAQLQEKAEGLENPVIVTALGNRPEHLFILTASLLAGFSVAMIDPTDGPKQVEKKRKLLGEPQIFFTDRSDLENTAALPDFSLKAAPVFLAHRRPEAAVQVFTSGSTGFSKVVEQREEGLLANSEALIRHHRLHERKRLVTSLPLFHVNCFSFGFLSTLLAGGRLALMEKFDLNLFLEILAEEKPKIASLIPPILGQLYQRREFFPKNSSLDYIVSAAAPLSPELAKKWSERFPVKLVQGYGLSEAINFSLTMPTNLPDSEHKHWMTSEIRPSLGVPLDFNTVEVWDEQGRPLPGGRVGELVIRGWNVMSGYRGDARKEVFRGEALHTGDLGFFRDDSQGRKFFFITGRIKDVIKRMGETVSLAEIDDVLSQLHLSPGGAIAVPFDNDIAGEEIAIVIQTDDPAEIDVASLTESLKSGLSEKAWPRVLAFTKDPVRTASGKASRWKFRAAFDEYRSRILGKNPITHADPVKATSTEKDSK